MSAAFEKALDARQSRYRDVVNDLRDRDVISGEVVEELREAIELVGCLRRLARERSVEEIHRAFGSPGDFGYDTAIGTALSRLYRGES